MHEHAPLRLITLFILIVLFAPQMSHAQSGDNFTGYIDAYARQGLPSPLSIDVQILDNAPRYIRLRKKFIARMRSDGIEVVADAPFVLILDIRTEREFQQTGKGYICELRIGREEGVSLRGKIWSNTQDSILGGRIRPSDRTVINRLQLTAHLSRLDDGRCMWQGRILHELQGRDPDHAAYKFVPVLAGAIGRTIQKKLIIVSD